MGTPKDLEQERLDDIEHWWELASGPGFYVDSKLNRRLYLAFIKVLLAMSQEEFDQFMEKQLRISCDFNQGSAYRFYIPLMKGRTIKVDHIDVNVISISTHATKWKEQKLENTVAHETAHHILNHPQCHGGSLEWETEADDVAVKWGFRRSYSKARLKALKRQIERISKESPET